MENSPIRDALLGVWVSMCDDAPVERVHMQPVEHDDKAVTAGGSFYVPHFVLADLWRASGGGAFAFRSGRMLWLREATTGWRPYCRPGLDELLPVPRAPDTRYSLEAVTALLRGNRNVVGFDVQDDAHDDHSRWRLTVWYGVLGEMQAWDRDGLFDVCDLS